MKGIILAGGGHNPQPNPPNHVRSAAGIREILLISIRKNRKFEKLLGDGAKKKQKKKGKVFYGKDLTRMLKNSIELAEENGAVIIDPKDPVEGLARGELGDHGVTGGGGGGGGGGWGSIKMASEGTKHIYF